MVLSSINRGGKFLEEIIPPKSGGIVNPPWMGLIFPPFNSLSFFLSYFSPQNAHSYNILLFSFHHLSKKDLQFANTTKHP